MYLTSEQYRDVLRHIPNCTEEIPTVQQLLRKAVETFYDKFGGYPELAGVAPGKVALFGEQTQFAHGVAMPAATPMMTLIVGRKVPGNRFTVVTTANVGKPHRVNFSFSLNRPLRPGFPKWLNYIKGVIEKYPEHVPSFEAAIVSSLPMGVGFGSSSAIQVATYTFLEILVGKKEEPIVKAKACQHAEREFSGNEVGLVDRLTSISAKDRKLMLIDCQTYEMGWIPFRSKKAVLIAVDSHMEDAIMGHEYQERSKYLTKACELLGKETLRGCTEEDILELENIVNYILDVEEEAAVFEEEEDEEEEEEGGEGGDEEEEEGTKPKNEWTRKEYEIMIKRARFFVTEMIRIAEAKNAWKAGDLQTFGEKLSESHQALKEDFDFNNPLLDFLVEASMEVEGVHGSRMVGMGLGYGGGIVSLVNKNRISEYCTYISAKFAQYEEMLKNIVIQARQEEDDRLYHVEKKYRSEQNISMYSNSSGSEGVFQYLKAGTLGRIPLSREVLVTRSNMCTTRESFCRDPKEICVRNQTKTDTWAKYKTESKKERFHKWIAERKDSLDSSVLSDITSMELYEPTFYIISPFPGARMMFVTKTDLLRSRFANPLPHPRTLIKEAEDKYRKIYNMQPEIISGVPAAVCIFGEFMEYHLGSVICMSIPLYCVMVGGKNDTVLFSVNTTEKEVKQPYDLRYPLPCVRAMHLESRTWANYVMAGVTEFTAAHVPGFNAVIHSSIPIKLGIRSSVAFQSCIFSFLENLTKTCTETPFEKAEKCAKNEYDFFPPPGEHISRRYNYKFFPTFLSKEGHLMLYDCKTHKVSHHYFDHPSYAFIIACCKKNDTNVTVEDLERRLRVCAEAIDILGRGSLINLDAKHIRCLEKRDATEEIIKRATYVITEHQRTLEVLKAVADENYERVGLLMNQSHASLRDDYEVSSPQIEELIQLALSVEGVLGAKMMGNGLKACIIILVKLSEAEKCIRYMKKNYKDKTDKPVFYIVKPTRGAFIANTNTESLPVGSSNIFHSYKKHHHRCKQ